MSIEPTIAHLLIATIAVLIAANIAVLIGFATRRKQNDSASAPLERISSRLDHLDRISGNLDDLSRLFLVPHARGGLGETLLYELLRTWLPERAYDTQYQFSDGTRPDAVIRLGDYLVPVDAKFPLDQVRSILQDTPSGDLPGKTARVFRKHIEDIGSKYIRPTEGTLEFAIMYIPSEAIYYRAFVETDGTMMDLAVRTGVVPAGPSSLFLYLQTVAFGLRGLSLNTETRELADLIHQLVHDFAELARSAETTATHIRNAQKNSQDLTTLASRFGALLDRLVQSRRPE